MGVGGDDDDSDDDERRVMGYCAQTGRGGIGGTGMID